MQDYWGMPREGSADPRVCISISTREVIFAFKRPQEVSDVVVGPCAVQMVSIQFFGFNIKLDT